MRVRTFGDELIGLVAVGATCAVFVLAGIGLLFWAPIHWLRMRRRP